MATMFGCAHDPAAFALRPKRSNSSRSGPSRRSERINRSVEHRIVRAVDHPHDAGSDHAVDAVTANLRRHVERRANGQVSSTVPS